MLKDKVLETIKKYNLIKNGDKVVVGVSGGPDSICLVDILSEIRNKEIKFDIVIAHVNHMIRNEAKSDEEFVKKYAEEKQILFFSKEIDVSNLAKSKKIGTEEAGREARYEFFAEVLKQIKANKIATAHTKSDNAETVLMNIIRGTGTFGLKGIQAKRDEIFIKPLIEIERNEIEEYCEDNKLDPRRDKTNDENIYTRNKVRNILIPLIKDEFNPNIIDTLDRLSSLATIENNYFDEMTNLEFEKILIKEDKEEIVLDLKEFNKKHEAIKSRIILLGIKKLLRWDSWDRKNTYK